MSKTRAVWLFIGGLTLIRLSMLGSTDLEFDEGHYWMWSERLAAGYFSKGPGIAFAIRASTAIFGPTEFGVRFWSPVLAACTSLLLFYFGKRLFSENVGLWAVIAFNVTPIFNIGAFVLTTDALSIFFWMAAMFTFWLATEKSPQFTFCSPLLFAALVWGVIGSWRRVNQQFKVLFLFWFGLPVFAFYFLLSLNHVATPNWDAVSFLSFGLLAAHYWNERIEKRGVRIFATAAVLLGFVISLFSLDSDLVR